MTDRELTANALRYMETMGIEKKCVNCKHCVFTVREGRTCKAKQTTIYNHQRACGLWQPNDNVKIVAAGCKLDQLDNGLLEGLSSNSKDIYSLAAQITRQEMIRNNSLRSQMRPELKQWSAEMSSLRARHKELSEELSLLKNKLIGISSAKEENTDDRLASLYDEMEREAEEKVAYKQDELDAQQKAIDAKQWEMDKWDYWVPELPKKEAVAPVRPETMQERVNKVMNMNTVIESCDGLQFATEPIIRYRRVNDNGRLVRATASTATIRINVAKPISYDPAAESEAIAYTRNLDTRLHKAYAEKMVSAMKALLNGSIEVEQRTIDARIAALEYWKKEAAV